VPWIRWGYGLPVAGKAVIALATVWPLVLGGRLLDRFGKGLRGAPRDALIADAVPSDQRGRAFGLHRAFDTAGALAGVLLSGVPALAADGHARSRRRPRTRAGAVAQSPAWVYRAISSGWARDSGLRLSPSRSSCASRRRRTPHRPPRRKPPRPPDREVSVCRARTGPCSRRWSSSPSPTAATRSSCCARAISGTRRGRWYSSMRSTNVTYAAFSYPAGVLSDKPP